MTEIINLGSRAITTALTDEVLTSNTGASGGTQEYVDRLEGMTSVSIQASFVYGSGETVTAIVKVQTSLDQGASWIDVCRFDFAAANAKKVANVSAAGALAPAAVSALGSESKLDGILGDRLRAVLTTTGTYGGNTSIAVRAAVR